jgi:hypothetical protein
MGRRRKDGQRTGSNPWSVIVVISGALVVFTFVLAALDPGEPEAAASTGPVGAPISPLAHDDHDPAPEPVRLQVAEVVEPPSDPWRNDAKPAVEEAKSRILEAVASIPDSRRETMRAPVDDLLGKIDVVLATGSATEVQATVEATHDLAVMIEEGVARELEAAAALADMGKGRERPAAPPRQLAEAGGGAGDVTRGPFNHTIGGLGSRTQQPTNADALRIAQREYPHDADMQQYIYDQQLAAMRYMQTVTDTDCRGIALREYPDDFSMQQFVYEQQLAARRSMDSAADQEVKQLALSEYPTDFSMQQFVYEQQTAAKAYMQGVADADVRSIALQEYPGDYSMQRFTYDQQLSAKQFMEAQWGSSAKVQALAEYPRDYCMQKFVFERETGG